MKKALMILRRNPKFANRRDDEIKQMIRRDAADILYQELRNHQQTNSHQLGVLGSWWRRGKIEAQTKLEVALSEKEEIVLKRVRSRLAAQYGLSVDLLDEFLRLRFQAQVRDWEAARTHERGKDMLTHSTGQQIRHDKARGKIDRKNYSHTTSENIRFEKAKTDEQIRLERERAKIERGNKRHDTIWDMARIVVQGLVNVGEEYAKTSLQREQMLNKLRYAATAQTTAGEFATQERMKEVIRLQEKLKHERNPDRKRMYKARIDQLMKEMGIERPQRNRPVRPRNRNTAGRSSKRTKR